MCGIIGIFGNNNPSEKARISLEKITHRGSSVFELKNFAKGTLGANRLPIVDREFGQQPLSNEEGTIFAAQNGEIFNYKELQDELRSKGHSFKTDSDTEVLVHLYEEYGELMVNKLDSEMFAFVIYDSKQDSIFAARDPLGVKPLYYAFDKTKQIYFASEAKQLTCFDDIEEVLSFPPGHYFSNGKFKKYSDFKINNKFNNESEVTRTLEQKLVNAVKKRVQTDLPIGVLLSGGVDSSLIMEIATRFHTDVTAIILGYPGSSDHEFALRLCRERGYKYHVVRPDIDYEKELDNLIYHLETYEPLIIRQSFSLDICAREAHRLGLRVVLVGEGSDELFAGYNEFSSLPDELINTGCEKLTRSLHFGHLQRVDRMSMKHTVEVRCPFFDKEVVDFAFQIHGKLKVKRNNHQIITKYIVRKVAENFLPDYIAWRYKVPFSNGAGMNVGNNFKTEDGDVAKIVLQKSEAQLPESVLNRYGISTKEERYYLAKFYEFGLTKLVNSEQRLVVKDNLGELYQSKDTRLVVAEFGRLAIYFPAYFAAESEVFKLHNLEVDFIATGGDDRTYASLVNNSAHIGLADPMFAMFENKEGVKGEIIGELVKSIPSVAVTLNPAIQISELSDFSKYRVGTFQEFTTTHSIAKYFLPKETLIQPYDYNDLVKNLVARTIDVAIVIPEQAIDLLTVGGRIVFDFSPLGKKFLFSGFTIANTLEPKYRHALKSFLVSVREATRYMVKNKAEAYKKFVKFFPELKNPRMVFDYYLKIWSTTTKVDQEDYTAAHKMWKQNYPDLLTQYLPYFRTSSPADPVLEKINLREYRRDFPFLEDQLQEIILTSLAKKQPLHFVGFWGAGAKSKASQSDTQAIGRLKSYFDEIQSVFEQGVVVTFILADEHAKSNGYPVEKYEQYLSDIKSYLESKGFATIYLSELWKKWGITQAKVNETLKDKPTRWWSDVSIAKELEEQASRRFLGGDKVMGAKKYHILRTLEKNHLEKEYKQNIFFLFGDGTMQSIYPKLPAIYLFAKNRGLGESPWFDE